MVNSQVVAEIVNALKLDQQVDNIPNPIPVIEVGVQSIKKGISRSQSAANATQTLIYATPTNADFYLTGGNLTFQKDATATSTLFNIAYVDENNQAQNLLTFGLVTLNAGVGSTQTPPFHPIKCARGSNITINSSTNTGNFKTTGQIYGYIDEVS